MDHLLFPFCLTWFGHIAIGWDGAELLGDICLPWHCWTIVKSLPRGDSAVATESGNCRVWSGQEVEGDAWGLIDVAVHDCFLHFLLVCLEETDWYFLTIFVSLFDMHHSLFPAGICVGTLDEECWRHVSVHFSQPMAPGWCEHVSGVPWLYYSIAPCVWLVKSSASDAGMLGKFEFKILTSS